MKNYNGGRGKLLGKGLIRESMSPCAVPALLTPKKDDDMLDQLAVSKVYSKIDLQSLGTQISLYDPRDEWKTSFQGLGEGCMNGCCDAIVGCPYAPVTQPELKKCSFATPSVLFLGFVISAEGVMVDRSKGGLKFYWTPKASESFKLTKKKMSEALVIVLPDFGKVFEVDRDTSKVGIGAVLTQEEHPVAFFSEKLCDSRLNYTMYDVEFYAIVRALRHWQHYLMHNEFILNSDHEALKYINNQHKLSPRHAKWVSFLQNFNFTLKHKAGIHNKVTNALSRRASYLSVMRVEFKMVFLFKGMQLCIPDCFLREKVVAEQHALGHFGRNKSIALVEGKYFWPKLKRDVTRHVERCEVCQRSKGVSTNARLYTPLPVPSSPWIDQDNGCLKCGRFVLQGSFSFAWVASNNPSDHDPKFIGHFWRTLWKKMGTQLCFSTSYHPETDGQTEVFAFNNSKNQTTQRSPFEIVHGLSPYSVTDLTPIPNLGKANVKADEFAKHIKNIHEEVKLQVEAHNAKYKKATDLHRRKVIFEEGDYVWVVLTKDRCSRSKC
ncbi:putative CCCH-type zinc finger family protein [Tanacetum coccineum]